MLIERWLTEYGHPETRRANRKYVRFLLDRDDVTEVTPGDVVTWCVSARSNNTVRSRAGAVRVFWDWCRDQGIAVQPVGPALERIRKTYPRLYAGAQKVHPPRWLSLDEIAKVIDACKDGTWIGSRDQLVIRWGLLGLRSGHLVSLRWGMRQSDGTWSWTGKGNRLRRVVPGVTLRELMDRYERAYSRANGSAPTADDPVFNTWRGGVAQWHRPLGPDGIWRVILHRSEAAGLGHVAPHDLRRSLAGILHHDRSADGGHRFDLADIQTALGHSQPTTTERSYLSPLRTDVLHKAGDVIDF